MSSVQKSNYEKRQLSDFENFFRILAGIGVAVSIIMLIWWFFFKINNATLYEFEYERSSMIYSDGNVPSSGETPLCDFDNCENEATAHVHTTPLYTNLVEDGMELLLNLPNKANFQSCTESFEYTEKNKHTVYDENTYLIPQGDGRIRVETQTNKYTVYTSAGTRTIEYVQFEGCYCNEHSEVARNIWRNEVEDAFINNNLGYYFYTYGLWASILLTPIIELLAFALLGLFVAIAPRKKVKI